MVHMLPFAPESGFLKTGYINPHEGHVVVRIRILDMVQKGRAIFIPTSGVLLSQDHIPPEFIAAVLFVRSGRTIE
eukprot:7074960-Prorocentrum_lima.AAC.1